MFEMLFGKKYALRITFDLNFVVKRSQKSNISIIIGSIMSVNRIPRQAMVQQLIGKRPQEIGEMGLMHQI